MYAWTREASGGEASATYTAVADALIPLTPELAREAGSAYLAGGAAWDIGQFVAMSLAKSAADPGLPAAAALMLDAAACQMIATGLITAPLSPAAFPGGGPFASLSREERIRALALLEQGAIAPAALPSPYREQPWMIAVTVDVLNRSAAMGFYSEWPGYGTTRLLPPDRMELQFTPPGWVQARFPGPSLGYRALRGFSVTESCE